MWRWGGECRNLQSNALSGSVPSELGNLGQLQGLYVHTALPAPLEGYRCGVCPFGLMSGQAGPWMLNGGECLRCGSK